MRGSVADPNGAAILHADVELRSREGTVVAQTTTDQAGHFQIKVAHCIDCTLTVAHPGFSEFTQPVTSATNVDVRLALAKVHTSIDVPSNSTGVSAETSENRNTTELDQLAMNELPILDQDYIGFLSQFLDSGMLGTNGVTLVVNGATANGPGVTASAVQSVKINDNPYSALFASPGKARLEITTIGGTPQFHGRITTSFRDSVFDATPAFATVKPSEQKKYFEGSLTGPISLLPKTTFLVSAQYDKTDDFAIVNAVTLNGAVHETVPQPQAHSFVSGRVFHDYGSGNQFWIGYSYEQHDNRNMYVGGLNLPEAGVHDSGVEHEINMQNTTVISPKWVNTLRLLVGHFDRPTVDNVEAPQVIVQGAFTGGSLQADRKRTETHLDGNDIVTYSSGKHELKFGIDVPDISRRGEDDFTDRLGVFTYASLADYQAGKAQTLQLKQGEGHLTFLEATFAGLIEDTYRVSPNFTVTGGVRYYFQNFFGDQPHNIAPRLGWAWRPHTDSKYVLRGGAGVFYDRSGPRAIADMLHYDLGRMRQYVINDPTFTSPGDLPPNSPVSLTRVSPGIVIPYWTQWSLDIERQVLGNSVVSVEYSGSHGIHQFRSLDTNAPLPGFSTRPDATFGQVRSYDSNGRSSTEGIEVNFRGGITKYFTGQLNYTYTRAFSDTDGITYIPSNSYAPEDDWGRSSWDMRHRFYIMGAFKLPYKFKLGTMFVTHSGMPYNETTGFDNNFDGVLN
ncbi:MAG: TonB-dependent receptor, partial [Acidobacteriales bacterium]|nr:TonB-dependent receptor [Terriglobales bacterium]